MGSYHVGQNQCSLQQLPESAAADIGKRAWVRHAMRLEGASFIHLGLATALISYLLLKI